MKIIVDTQGMYSFVEKEQRKLLEDERTNKENIEKVEKGMIDFPFEIAIVPDEITDWCIHCNDDEYEYLYYVLDGKIYFCDEFEDLEDWGEEE